jgi:hypothetical protein
MHINYNLPTNVMGLMHFKIIFNVNELQQLAHVLIIGHGSTFKQQMKNKQKIGLASSSSHQ